MIAKRPLFTGCILALFALSACGGSNSLGGSANSSTGIGSGNSSAGSGGAGARTNTASQPATAEERRETIWDIVGADRGTEVAVNRYLWRASFDVLGFLPLEAADPFTGVIAFDWGTAPGSRRAYRATVYITDPALDARSLRVAVQSRGGAASAETQRQIENAILSRARQLRIQQAGLLRR